jgi:hypothetical protein
MTVGLSTYAFFWQWQTVADPPLSLLDMIDPACSTWPPQRGSPKGADLDVEPTAR